MQYVSGHSLQDKIDRVGPLNLNEILRIGMQMAAGLAAAHAQGLAHRDIKPANVLLENGVERVKITDFGLARAIDDSSLSASGTVAGTPSYMSPEQARGEPLDRRTDLFSLGSTLYAMCTGQAPFRASSSVAVLRKVSDEQPRPIRMLNPEIPEWLVAVVSRLLAKDPDERYQSAGAVAELLSMHLAELQQPTRPPTGKSIREGEPAIAPGHRSGRQRPTLVLAFLVVAAGIVIAAIATNLLRPKGDSTSGAPARPVRPSRSRTIPRRLTWTFRPRLSRWLNRHGKPRSAPSRWSRSSTQNDVMVGAAYRRSIALYTAALLLDPSCWDAYYNRGLARESAYLRDWDGAIDDLTAAIRLRPTNPLGFRKRAIALRGKGNFDAAISDGTTAIHLAPNDAAVYVARALAYCWAGQPDGAIQDLDHGLKLEPDDYIRAYALHLRGWAYALKKEWGRTIADYDAALRIRLPDKYVASFAFVGRANCRALTGRFDEAVADYQKSFELDPARARDARSERAYYIYYLRNDFEKVISECKEIILVERELCPGVPLPWTGVCAPGTSRPRDC